MPEEADLVEVLELIKTLTQERGPTQITEIASRLHRTLEQTQELTDVALKRGLMQNSQYGVSLTREGEALVREHQEEYVHRTHVHGSSLANRVSRVLEGRIDNWHGHWHRHGFDDEWIHGFHRKMHSLESRIEETKWRSLADLSKGEKCSIVLPMGGHRIVRRLAEMGLTPGTEVVVIRSAPMHGPIEISARGVSLVLGRGIARRILVRPLHDDESSSGT